MRAGQSLSHLPFAQISSVVCPRSERLHALEERHTLELDAPESPDRADERQLRVDAAELLDDLAALLPPTVPTLHARLAAMHARLTAQSC